MKSSLNNDQTLIPRVSLRINPSDMKNHTDDKREIIPIIFLILIDLE